MSNEELLFTVTKVASHKSERDLLLRKNQHYQQKSPSSKAYEAVLRYQNDTVTYI